MKKILIALLVAFALYGALNTTQTVTDEGALNTAQPVIGEGSRPPRPASGVLESAFRNQQSNLQVSGTGEVIRLLADDNDGSRHQKFILELASGQTILIAHNIDLAPRINSLRTGDTVEFNGEYEWNDRGGVVHWTHHDPAGRHINGWLKHQGSMYQ